MAYKINKSQWAQLKKASTDQMNNINSKSNTTYTNNHTTQLGSVAF